MNLVPQSIAPTAIARQSPVAAWRAGVMSLPADRVPCDGLFWCEPGAGIRPLVWPEVRSAMLRFLDHWGEEAAVLGWDTGSLFGVHPTGGAVRADYTGALVALYPRQIVALTAHAITSSRRGTLQTSRRRPTPRRLRAHLGLPAGFPRRELMPQITPDVSDALRDLTTVIATAYVSHHHIPRTEVPGLITTVYGALAGIASGAGSVPTEESTERPTPAQIRKSITPDALMSFLDGRPYKTLKRHLTKFGFTPQTYRERFGLPGDYPMVAPTYSATRSALAQQLGLGRKSAPEEMTPPSRSIKRLARKAAE